MAIEIKENASVTASLPTPLLRAVEKLAWEIDLSVDELIQLALEAYVQQQAPFSEERRRIAESYVDYPDEDDLRWEAAMLDDARRRLREDEKDTW